MFDFYRQCNMINYKGYLLLNCSYRTLVQPSAVLSRLALKTKQSLISNDSISLKNLSKRTFSSSLTYRENLGRKQFTASLIATGQELLEGKRFEKNSVALAINFQDNPIQLRRVEIIPDCQEEIKKAILKHSKEYDLVFTSGGLSSKHETKIYETVADLYNIELNHHQPTLSRMEEVNRFLSRSTSPEMLEARKKLAFFPVGSRVVYPCQHQWIPIVIVNNQIHIMPGTPEIFHSLTSDYFKFPIMEFLGFNRKTSDPNLDAQFQAL